METKTGFLKVPALLGGLFAFVLVYGCGSAADKASESEIPGVDAIEMLSQVQKASEKTPAETATNKDHTEGQGGTLSTGDPGGEVIPPKVIKTGNISMQVDNYEKTRNAIPGIIKKYNAGIASENQTGDAWHITNQMTIRVASESFDSLVDNLLSLATLVDYKRINEEDVTEEYIDIQARLKTKKEIMVQYQSILRQAHTISDILNVQQYVRVLQEETESLEGRLKYLNNRTELSTISLTFYEKSDNMPVQTNTFGSRVVQALAWGWQGLVSFVIAIIYLWPLWLFTAAVIFGIVRLVKRAKKRKAAKA